MVVFAVCSRVSAGMREWLAHVVLMVLVLVSSPWTLLYIYVRLQPALFPGEPVFRRDDCAAPPSPAPPQPSQSLASLPSCRAHPACMADWVLSGRDGVRKVLRERGFLALDTHINGSSGSSSSGSNKSHAYLHERAVIRVGPDAPLLRYLHHIPHFSEVYFSFFSVALWSCALQQEQRQWKRQRRRRLDQTSRGSVQLPPAAATTATATALAPTTAAAVVVNGLEIDTASRQFWTAKMDGATGKGAWLRGVVAAAEAILGANTVLSPPSTTCATPSSSSPPSAAPAAARAYTTGRNPAGWFLHASDAYLLGSRVVGEDPCGAPRNTSTRRRPGERPAVRVGVLQRRRDRVLLNAAALSRARAGPDGANVTWVPAFVPEGKPLRAQATALRALDVVLSVHGAGLTNIAWMRPCSVVFEAFPYGYYLPGYFGGLAAAAGLVYRAWHAGPAATVTTALLRNKPHCRRAFAEVEALAESRTEGAGAYAERCFRHVRCRACARGADGVVVDPDVWHKMLPELLAQREQCIRQHPFLRR